jgi:hypothetical protein
MNRNYFCQRCRDFHDVMSGIGIKHLPIKLSKRDVANFINAATTIPTYEVVTGGIPGVFEGTDAFVREIKIAQTLQEKFPNMDAYKSAEGLKDWLAERLQMSNSAAANALSRIQGDAAGEVDFIREMQGNIRSLFTRTDFPRNEDGRIVSNNPGVDAVEINRFTGDIVNEYQIKTLRSADSIDQTLEDFLNNDSYKPTTVLVGPQELIDRAHELGIPNPTKVMGTLQDNLQSAQELSDKILSGQLAVGMTPGAVAGEMIGGAGIGAAISVTVSSLVTYLQYKSGNITFDEMKSKLAKDGVKGAITGGALAGLSLFIPGGLIGAGIGYTVGITLRRLLDEAYGDGMFGEVMKLTGAVHANVQMAANGAVYIARFSEMNGHALAKAVTVVDDLYDDRIQADNIYTRLERVYDNGMRIDYSESAERIFARLDAMRNRMQGGESQ